MILKHYTDRRIGNMPRDISTSKEPNPMRIPDSIKKCVTFVGYPLGDGRHKFGGTAFFVGVRTTCHALQCVGTEGVDQLLLVTAKHCLEDARKGGGMVRSQFA